MDLAADLNQDALIDALFVEKFMSQTKKTVGNREFKIFTRQQGATAQKFIYTCHLCGIKLEDETELHVHVLSKIHVELMRMEVVPMQSWMKEAIVGEDPATSENKKCVLGGCGDCSLLKTMLDKMCRMKPNDGEIVDLTSPTKSVRQKTSKRKQDSPDHKISPKKHRSSRSRVRKSHSHRRKKYLRHRSDSDSDDFHRSSPKNRNRHEDMKLHSRNTTTEKTLTVAKPRTVQLLQRAPEITLLSVCRYLVTLEDHISKFSKEIKFFFTASLNNEREEPGSSNKLLTDENKDLLEEIKTHLKDLIVEGSVPCRLLGIAKAFVNDFEKLTKTDVERQK